MKRAAPSNDNIQHAANPSMRHAVTLYETGQLPDAERACEALLSQHPQDADVHNLLGAVHAARKAFPAAIPCFKKAVALAPAKVSFYTNLASALRQAGRAAEAVPVLKKAMQLTPDNPEVYLGLGHTAVMLENLPDAESCYQQALALDSSHQQGWFHLGMVQAAMGKMKEALLAYTKAVELRPGDTRALYDRSLCLLTLADFEEGFAHYELRWMQEGMPTLPKALAGKAMWDGKTLDGTLLILKEQGAGDIFQSLRFLPEVRKKVKTLILQVPGSVRGIAERMGIADEIITPEQPIPGCDSFAPILSLPRILGITEKDLPGKVPYLAADKKRQEYWGKKLEGAGKKVGLAWRGAPGHVNDRNRSMALAQFESLFALPGTTFYSLQKGKGEEELEAFAAQKNLVPLGAEIKDFDDTAAILSQLDVLISVDTSVVHLAGALSVPCWALIPFVPDWRWQMKRGDSPWYPSIRLFRQEAPKDWEGVIARIKKALSKL